MHICKPLFWFTDLKKKKKEENMFKRGEGGGGGGGIEVRRLYQSKNVFSNAK